MSELEDLNKLKVTELKAQLQALGLDTKGVKAVLIDRLREALDSKNGAVDSETVQKSNVSEGNEEIADQQIIDDKDDEEAEERLSTLDAEPINEHNGGEDKDELEEDKDELEEDKDELEEDKDELEEDKDEIEEDKDEIEEDKDEIEEDKEEIEEDKEEIEEDKEEIEEDKDEIKEDKDESIKHEDLNKDYFEKENFEDDPMTDLEKQLKEELEETFSTENKQNCDVKQENMELKTEEDEEDEEEHKDERRGTKRAHSESHEESKRPRPDVEEVRVEDEPEFDKSVVALDWYNSDLSLTIDKETRSFCTPMVIGGFAYVWHGVRATYGATKGKIYYEVRIEDELSLAGLDQEEEHPHVVRCGWSVDDSNLILGEEPLSFGYGGTGKASTNLKFKDYGVKYGKGDIIGCFLDLDSEPITLSYTVNGENHGICYEITRSELGDSALFPHILTKNCSFKVNFGAEDSAFEPLTDYSFIGKVDIEELVMGTQGPEKREDAEVIMMVGLPAAGKTTWVENYCKENPEKKFNVLGTNNLIDRMKVQGLPRKRNYAGRWETLIDKCTKCLNKLLHLATKRRRNFIIDQTNVYPSAQKRKIKGFVAYKRRAVVVFPSDEELKIRTEKREKQEGKDVPDKAVLEMKANFKLPEVGDFFDEVEFVELQQEEAVELLKLYNKEGEKAGFGPKSFFNDRNQQNKRVGYVDRRGKYNNRGGGGGGGYRGGWDRDRDRRGGFDRRDRGGWNNRDKDNRRDNFRDRTGGFNRDRGHRGGGGWQGNYKGHNQNNKGNTWASGQTGQQDYNNSWGNQGYGNQGWASQAGYGTGYNWNQQYYGQQQQQTQQPYWNQSYGTAQAGYTAPAQTSYGNQGYNQGNYGYGQQQQATTGQQQWGGGYGASGYGTANTSYTTQTTQPYNRTK